MSKKKIEKELEVKTYEEWAKELLEKEGIEIIDPDGFRNNPQDTYTKEEFNKRLLTCTIQEKMSKVHKEKLDKLVKETVDKLIGEETKEKIFTNIKKLKCDYTTYKEERTKYNMPVETNCAKCGKSFEAGEEIYTADIGTEPLLKQVIICRNCVKGE